MTMSTGHTCYSQLCQQQCVCKIFKSCVTVVSVNKLDQGTWLMPRPTTRTNWENSQTGYTPLKEGYQAFTLESFRHSGSLRGKGLLVS